MKTINVDIIHEELLKNKPKLSYSNDLDYLSWKKQIKEKYLELLGFDNISKNECDLNFEIEETIETKEYTRYRFTFESEKYCIVPCYLLIPKGEKKKWPVCICLQGHTTGFHISIGEKKYEIDDGYLETSTFAIDAVKHGFAAFCIEQRGMGERTTPLKSRHTALTCGCYHTAMTALLLGRTLIGERVWDVRKGIDCLSKFEDYLNLDDISILGNSGGGTASYYSACYDEIIKNVVVNCAISTYKDSIAAVWHCSCNYIPHSAEFFDMGELSSLVAPRKLLILAGELDPIFPLYGAKEVFKTMEKIYKKEDASNSLRMVIITGKAHYFDKELAFTNLLEMKDL